jgi:hypothetical protein
MNSRNHNRKSTGRFNYSDHERRTPEQVAERREATTELMRRNSETPIQFDVHCMPPSYAAQAAREGMMAIAAIHRGNVLMARDYAISAVRLARLEQGL